MTEHITAVTQMISDKPSMLYPTVDDDDNENDHLDEEYAISSESKSDNMGSSSPIDDLIQSGTLRLLDWNDSMSDIQLGIRFVNKVQAISVRYLSQTSSKKYKYYFKRVGTRFRGEMDYQNPDSPPRCGRCRVSGHNRKNCNNPSSNNV
ncbi:hypothetical protein M9H77_21073 [Catharanthus roseus]|uniref:Uncharacterized protein n=1 Tax=Catharanthus roseus TaxID=4058 RepID=A0ACC0ALJ2_CATRO|nr:hypothetical protein M9H77_21073 [Catharanthus roseus]